MNFHLFWCFVLASGCLSFLFFGLGVVAGAAVVIISYCQIPLRHTIRVGGFFGTVIQMLIIVWRWEKIPTDMLMWSSEPHVEVDIVIAMC